MLKFAQQSLLMMLLVATNNSSLLMMLFQPTILPHSLLLQDAQICLVIPVDDVIWLQQTTLPHARCSNLLGNHC